MSTTKKSVLTLVVLALLALALQSIVFSGASFTSSAGNPGNVFTAGSLSHSNTADGQIVLSAAGLRPGQTSTPGTLSITGGGTVSGTYTLSKASLVDNPAGSGFSGALTLLIEDTTGAATTIYNGTVAAFTSISLGPIAPTETRSYRFTLTYVAASATSAMQGATCTLGLQFTGVSP